LGQVSSDDGALIVLEGGFELVEEGLEGGDLARHGAQEAKKGFLRGGGGFEGSEE
jgi:hypothetical protein